MTGDRDADVLRRLNDEHAPALFRYVVWLTRDRARAEDIVQETLLKAWQHPEIANDRERSPRAWLFTVARNMVVDEWRSARFRIEFGVADPIETCDRPGADEMDSAVDRILLRDALARLSQAHRDVIGRAYYQRRTTAEIATDLGIAHGTVRSRLHYAVRALRVALDEMGYDGARAAGADSTISEANGP